MAEQRLDVDLTGEPAVDELGYLRPPLHAAERRAGDAAAGDEKPRDDVEGLPLAGNAAHRREAPRLARGLDGLAHDVHVSRRLERVVGAEPACLGADPVDRVLARETRVGRAVVTRALQALLGEV